MRGLTLLIATILNLGYGFAGWTRTASGTGARWPRSPSKLPLLRNAT